WICSAPLNASLAKPFQDRKFPALSFPSPCPSTRQKPPPATIAAAPATVPALREIPAKASKNGHRAITQATGAFAAEALQSLEFCPAIATGCRASDETVTARHSARLYLEPKHSGQPVSTVSLKYSAEKSSGYFFVLTVHLSHLSHLRLARGEWRWVAIVTASPGLCNA